MLYSFETKVRIIFYQNLKYVDVLIYFAEFIEGVEL
jgi:hypothetical protein